MKYTILIITFTLFISCEKESEIPINEITFEARHYTTNMNVVNLKELGIPKERVKEIYVLSTVESEQQNDSTYIKIPYINERETDNFYWVFLDRTDGTWIQFVTYNDIPILNGKIVLTVNTTI